MALIRTPNETEIKIAAVKFKCDASLGNHIPSPLAKGNQALFFVGGAGSGKTTVLTNLISGPYKKVFDKIWLFCPSNSLLSLEKKHPFLKYIDETADVKHSGIVGYVFNELSAELLQICINESRADAAEGKNTLIIADDQLHMLRGDKRIETLLKEILANRRHYHMSLFCLVQLWISGVPKCIRLQASAIFLWKPTKREYKDIREELFVEFTDPEINVIAKECWREPHDFLYLTQNNLGNAVYDKNFARLSFDE